MHNENDNFDFPTWEEIQNKATELIGIATQNPVAVASAQTAQQANEVIKKAALSDPKVAKAIQDNGLVVANQVAPHGSIDFGILKNLKWILLIVFIVALVGLFYRIKG